MQLRDGPFGPRPHNDNRSGEDVHFADDLIMGLRFYSRLPTGRRPHQRPNLSQIARALPFASLVIGLAPAVLLVGLEAIGTPHLFAATLAVALLVIVSGAMSEDALADAADGLFGGPTIEERLAIMKDSRHGTYGVAAICLLLLLRVSAVASVPNPIEAAGIWLAASLMARSGSLWLTLALPAARSGGAAATAGQVTQKSFALGGCLAVVLSCALAGFAVGVAGLVAAYALCALLMWGWVTLCRRLVGGQTGDLIGAGQALLEISALTAFMCSCRGSRLLFIGVALLVAVGIGLLVSADAGAWIGLTQTQFGQLLPLVILGIIFAAGAFSRRQRFSAIAGNLLVWVGIFVAALVGYTYRYDIQGVAARVYSELSTSTPVIDSQHGTATFRRGPDGHFDIAASVNGAGMPLLFDTGASAVVLSYADAQRAGIDVAALRFNIPVTTANGTGRAAEVTLDRVEVGGIARGRIRAFVAERGALEGSLLGMSFLETLSRYSVAGDRLELAD